MWRFAVLYSMAKSLGRIPGIHNTSTYTCDKLNDPHEIEKTFPIWQQNLLYFVSTQIYNKIICDTKIVTN
jgi:hypothetical protein